MTNKKQTLQLFYDPKHMCGAIRQKPRHTHKANECKPTKKTRFRTTETVDANKSAMVPLHGFGVLSCYGHQVFHSMCRSGAIRQKPRPCPQNKNMHGRHASHGGHKNRFSHTIKMRTNIGQCDLFK
jgi:hypothetical protein